MNVWAKEGDRVLEKGRGGDAPYRISNETGTPVQILSDVGKKGAKQATPVQLNDGQTIDWRFDDWKTLREVIILHVPKTTKELMANISTARVCQQE